LLQRLRDLRQEGLTAGQIADKLNREGFRCARPGDTFAANKVRQLLSRWGLSGPRVEQVPLGADEWWLFDLARHLSINGSVLRKWANRRWVHCRRSSGVLRWRILWADAEEIERLKRLRDYAKAHPYARYPRELTVRSSDPCRPGRHQKSEACAVGTIVSSSCP
jgi:hypothetical protein